MIHFVPIEGCPAPAPLDESLARLASLRHALHLVEQLGGRDPSQVETLATVETAWDAAGASLKRCVAERSQRAVAAAEAGLEALALLRDQGVDANPASLRKLADELSAELGAIDQLFSL